MKIVVFLGPTLPTSEASQLLDAIYLPPVSQGDLISAVRIHHPDVIGIVDGVFYQSLSVWHKEILYALSKGIRVYGASSMGALRAAETAAFGMVGIGRVYEQFAYGTLNDDDEVAIVHAPADEGYRPLSEAMVNIRATFFFAHEHGIISDSMRDDFLRIAKVLHFPQRTFPAIFREALSRGIPNEVIQKLECFVRDNFVDQKRKDARLLLETLATLTPSRNDGQQVNFNFEDNYLFRSLWNRDRKIKHMDVEFPVSSLAEYVAVNVPDYARLNDAAMNRTLVNLFASMLQIEATAEDCAEEERAFRNRLHLLRDPVFEKWLSANDLEDGEFRNFIRQLATCRRLQRWLLSERWIDRNTPALLDELRIENRYNAAAESAALEHSLAANEGTTTTDLEVDFVYDLVSEHIKDAGWCLDRPLEKWISVSCFRNIEELRMALWRAKVFRSALLKMVPLLEEINPAMDGGSDGT